MRSEFPVYDICKFSYDREEDIIVKPFAPYFKTMRKLDFPHRHDFYHILLFGNGAGTHSIDFETFPISPFHIYFMAPGQVHGWNFQGEVDGYVINFSADFYKSFLRDSLYLEQFPFFSGNVHYSVTDIAEKDQAAVVQIMKKAVLEAERPGRFRTDILRVLLLELFFLIARSERYADQPETKAGQNHTVLRSFEKLIEKHYKEERLPRYYAEKLAITPSHLNAICKEFLGRSAGDLIRNRIVLEAKRKLINIDFTVSEIAYSLNFSDNSYFCKFFKNQAGVSPETFRKGYKS